MIISNGKNQYPDGRFRFWEWSAPILQSPEEVLRAYQDLWLEDRVIKDIIAVGMGYDWSENGIDDTVYNAYEALLPGERERIDPKVLFPAGVNVYCGAQIDEPLLILFADGDVLAISFDEGSSVRMDLNTIPVDIQPRINPKTFHGGRLFEKAVGRRLAALEVRVSTEMPDFTFSHGLTLEKQPCYISRLEFVLEAPGNRSNRCKLCFEAWADYGWVELTDSDGTPLRVPARKIPWITEGYAEFDEV